MKAIVAALGLLALLLATAPDARAVAKETDPGFADRLTHAVTEALVRELGGVGRRVDDVTVAVPVGFVPPEGYDELAVLLPYKKRLTHRVFVSVRFQKAGRTIGKLNVVATADVYAQVVVTTRDVARGAYLSKEDLLLDEVRLDPSHNGVVTDLAEAVGKTAERKLAAGTPLRSAFLAQPMLVNAGDRVTVVARSGALQITSQGLAKEDGDRGQWIRIMNLTSNKLFTARVSGPGMVEVAF